MFSSENETMTFPPTMTYIKYCADYSFSPADGSFLTIGNFLNYQIVFKSVSLIR